MGLIPFRYTKPVKILLKIDPYYHKKGVLKINKIGVKNTKTAN